MSRLDRGTRILLVDDDQGVVEWLSEALTAEGHRVTSTTSPAQALETASAEAFDIVIADVEMPGLRGPDLLRAVQERRPDQLVLLITAFGSISLATQALRAGACDFVTKPFPIEVLLHAVERALQERQMRREIVRLRAAATSGTEGIVARSESMRRVVELAGRASRIDSTVLLTGESGTGKGALARYIHASGPRAGGPFIHVNCAALPENLVESELFGVRKGAFTDAREDRRGLFVEADGGTLFLDEIGELPLDAQAKLLQALETGKVRAVGATSEVPVRTRIVAATNQPLEDAIREKRFRNDLYYRLNVIRLDIPPLRDRREDIPELLDLLLHRACEKLGRPMRGIAAPAMRWLTAHAWPGNVRELTNVVERAVALSDHDTIVLEDLLVATKADEDEATLAGAAARHVPLADVERAYISAMLAEAGGNMTLAARLLGIDRRTLYRKVRQEEPAEPS